MLRVEGSMHLVYAIDCLGSGGAQRQAVALASHLGRESGTRVTVLVYRKEDFHATRLRAVGVDVVRLPKRLQIDPLLPWRVRRWMGSNPIDLVHAFLPMPCFWYFLGARTLSAAKRPAFVAGERSAFEGHSWLQNVARSTVYRRADAVTVNARSMGEQIHDRLGVDSARTHYFPNGIDLAAWDEEARAASPYELERDRFHFALVGGLRREKNHILVLEALEILGTQRTRDWRLWFVGGETGEPGYAEQVRHEVERRALGDRVRIVPAVQEIAALMRRLDGLLLPSAYEGFPNVALEAMASRVPVIASRVGDVPNLVENGRSGFLLESTDAPTLAKAMQHFHSLSAEERVAMGSRARERVEARFEISRVAQGYLGLYQDLLRNRRSVRTTNWRPPREAR